MTSSEDARGERALAIAEHIRELLIAEGAPCAVIGAIALAVHGYARATFDLDLGTTCDPFVVLRKLESALATEGFETKLITPDADDPLGGVLNVQGKDFDPIQVVNFANPLSIGLNPGIEAVREAKDAISGTKLPVVDLPHLVALKLYAGGSKSRVDVIELLRRNPRADLAAVREVCARFGLGAELDALMPEVGR